MLLSVLKVTLELISTGMIIRKQTSVRNKTGCFVCNKQIQSNQTHN